MFCFGVWACFFSCPPFFSLGAVAPSPLLGRFSGVWSLLCCRPSSRSSPSSSSRCSVLLSGARVLCGWVAPSVLPAGRRRVRARSRRLVASSLRSSGLPSCGALCGCCCAVEGSLGWVACGPSLSVFSLVPAPRGFSGVWSLSWLLVLSRPSLPSCLLWLLPRSLGLLLLLSLLGWLACRVPRCRRLSRWLVLSCSCVVIRSVSRSGVWFASAASPTCRVPVSPLCRWMLCSGPSRRGSLLVSRCGSWLRLATRRIAGSVVASRSDRVLWVGSRAALP